MADRFTLATMRAGQSFRLFCGYAAQTEVMRDMDDIGGCIAFWLLFRLPFVLDLATEHCAKFT
jgi:hypothetical protein